MAKRKVRKDRLGILLFFLIIVVLLIILIINSLFKNKDSEYPVLKLKGESEITINLNSTYEELGYEATDETDGDITNKVKVEGNVDTSKGGEYILTYSVSDKGGNLTKKTRKVIVNSKSPLTMSLAEFNIDDSFKSILKETEDGKEEYSDEFIFAGDSMALYYVINEQIPGTRLWHQISITSLTALTSPIYVNHNDTGKTFVEVFKEKKPEKVLFTLGTNSVATMKVETFIENYKKLIKGLKEASPDTLLVIQSIPPVPALNDENNYGLNNKDINEFNYYLAQMCDEENLYFLNSASAMKDEFGQCKEGYCLKDSHPTKLGQEALMKYFQTHMVK